MQIDADRDEMGYGADYDVPNYDAPDEDSWDLADSRAYWRRRFIILCGGVAALGVCAWLLPGAHSSSSRPSAAASESMAALARQQSLPPAATGSAWQPPTPTPTPRPTPPVSAAKLAATASTARQKVSLSYQPRSSGAATVPAPACSPGDVVLSLFTSQSSYATGDEPKFSVYAVSTAGAACTMTYGAGSVQVVVTQRGQVVWDSAACKPPAANKVRFTLGVPHVLTLSWNRKAAGPAGCAGSLTASASGTYDAVAMRSGESGQSSPVATFKLGK
jgi:hypothetical protein